MKLIDRQIKQLMKQEDWNAARVLLRKSLKQEPDDHQHLSNMAWTYLEQRKYKKALEWNIKAYAIAPNCPSVIWDYACTLDSLELSGGLIYSKLAIAMFQRLLKLRYSVKNVCWEKRPKWAVSLKNDCRYRIGLCHLDLDDYVNAVKYLRTYLSCRKKGVSSMYKKKYVENELDMCLQLRNG